MKESPFASAWKGLESTTCAVGSPNTAQRRMLLSNQGGGGNLWHVKVLRIECGVDFTDKVGISASNGTSWLLLCVKSSLSVEVFD